MYGTEAQYFEQNLIKPVLVYREKITEVIKLGEEQGLKFVQYY